MLTHSCRENFCFIIFCLFGYKEHHESLLNVFESSIQVNKKHNRKLLKMRGLIVFSVVFSCLISLNCGIPYSEFHINVLKSGQTNFETLLRASMTTKKNIFASNEVKLITTIATVGLKQIIGPAAAVLPMIQTALSKESDWVGPMIKTITSQQKRTVIELELHHLQADSKQISDSILQLNESLHRDPQQKKDFEKMKDVSNVGIVQNSLVKMVGRFADGDSPFLESPELAVGPLLALSALISLFAPIRDSIYQNTSDETIVSCLLSEALNQYLPKVDFWRLNKIEAVQTVARLGQSGRDKVVQSVVFNADIYSPGKPHSDYSNTKDVRCDRNTCVDGPNNLCFKDTMQDDTIYSPQKNDVNLQHCMVDYLLMVRSRVHELFDTAIGLANSTCSDVKRNRHQDEKGEYHFCVCLHF